MAPGGVRDPEESPGVGCIQPGGQALLPAYTLRGDNRYKSMIYISSAHTVKSK